jgi:hypothetical protein
MPTFITAEYVANDLPPPEYLIRAVDEDGVVWWLQEDCAQGDWLRYREDGGTVREAGEGSD